MIPEKKHKVIPSDILDIAESMSREAEYLNEMARIGWIDNDKLEVYVNTDDGGEIPHFHVKDAATHGQDFHTCIEIMSAKYFHHTGKEDFLNTHQRKQLNTFLMSEPDDEDSPFNTNWESLVYEWNRNNSDKKVDRSIAMPDYKTIIDNK